MFWGHIPSRKKNLYKYYGRGICSMNIKKAIQYAQVALKNAQEENKNKQLTAKQLGETMWRMYYLYDDTEIQEKATRIINDLELKNN